MTISEAKSLLSKFSDYLEKNGNRPSTVTNKVEALQYVFDNIPSFDYSHFLKFIEFKKSTGTSDSRLNQFIYSLRIFVRFLKENNFEYDPKLLNIKHFIKKEQILTGSLERDEVKKLIWATPDKYNYEENNNKWGTFFALMAYTGLSSSEVAELKCSDVDLENGYIRVASNANYKVRITLIPNKIINTLKLILSGHDSSEYIFKRKTRTNIPETPVNASYQFRKRLKLIGLTDSQIIARKLRPHSLRKFYIEECIRNKIPVQDLGALVGHNRYRQTNLYDKVSDVSYEEIKDKVNKMFDS